MLLLHFLETDSTEASAFVKRWDSRKKEHTDVTLPDIIADYNSSMSGVDLANMLIALYKTEIV